MALQKEEANETLEKASKKKPENLIPLYLRDYQDCIELLFNGNADDYSKLKSKMDERLTLLEQGAQNSPWYLFCKANIQLHWALAHLRFGDNFKSATRFRKSFLLLKENETLYPQFEENKVLLGLEKAMAGAIPDNYKWLGSLLGIKGDINKGVSGIVTYLNAHPDGNAPMYDEAAIYYVYLKFYLLSEPEAAWKYLNSANFNEDNNLMRSFIKANIALNYRKAETAENILNVATANPYWLQYPILQYELAEAMLYNLNLNCVALYQQFSGACKGFHFVKDAYLKMAWASYLQGNKTKQNYYLELLKEKGNTTTDADKQAQRFAEKPNWPMKSLLEVRLLIDGGAYKAALAKIQSIDQKSLSTTEQVLEYNFRYGRIFEELKTEDKAIQFYNATIQAGRDKKEYFAARAALQKGFIYERQGKKADAIAQFKDCLSMRNHDLQTSIDQLAKAGLNRLGN